MTPPEHLGRPEVRIRRNPWFWIVLALKLAASAFFGSHYVRDLFIPFISWFVHHPLSNPWDEFLATGPTDAFPYSAVMLAVLAAPQGIATAIAPGFVDSHEWVKLLLIRLPMLGADLTIFAILLRWFDAKRERVLWIYWCSPILFYISYIHGQIDSIPTALLFVSLFLLFQERPLAAGAALGLGIAAKLHVLIAVPFLAIHVWNSRTGRARLDGIVRFLAGTLAVSGALVLAFANDPGYRTMVLGTRESERLFELALPIAGSIRLYLAPVAIVIVLLRYVLTHWSNRDVLMAFLALAFSVLLIFVPPMPGWYYWSIPLVAYFYIQQEAVGETSLLLLSLFYVTYYLFFWNLTSDQLPDSLRAIVEGMLLRQSRLESLAFTALQGSLALVIFWVWRMGLQDNAALRARRVPVLVGIAGDSASGKHTLATLLRDVLGGGAIQTNGDDYHRWPRGHAGWRDTTALNPQGNQMALAASHAETLKKGEPIRKTLYDHDTGLFTNPMIVAPRRFVLFVGLHSFALRRTRSLLDLRIFMEPDEELRQAWKIERDQRDRGYGPEQVVAQIRSREADAARYVRPQRAAADWIIRYQVAAPAAVGSPGAFTVRHLLWNDLPIEPLVAALSAIPGVSVANRMEDLDRQSFEVTGSVSGSAVKDIATRLFPNAMAQLDPQGIQWRGDQAGVTQLVFLLALENLPGEVHEAEPALLMA
jgi:uridine kinase